MGLFGKKKEKVVDWSEGFRATEKRVSVLQQSSDTSSSNNTSDSYTDLGVLGNFANASSSSSSSDVSWDNDNSSQNEYPEKKQKLAKRLLDMTNKIEDLSNQVYHLTQRIELLEKKLRIAVN